MQYWPCGHPIVFKRIMRAHSRQTGQQCSAANNNKKQAVDWAAGCYCVGACLGPGGRSCHKSSATRIWHSST